MPWHYHAQIWTNILNQAKILHTHVLMIIYDHVFIEEQNRLSSLPKCFRIGTFLQTMSVSFGDRFRCGYHPKKLFWRILNVWSFQKFWNFVNWIDRSLVMILYKCTVNAVCVQNIRFNGTKWGVSMSTFSYVEMDVSYFPKTFVYTF